MRTTLTLEPDVAAEIERRRRERNTSLKEEVNGLLRLGLRSAEAEEPREPFHTQSIPMGRLLIDITSVSRAIEEAEGPDHK
jgi:hypothetical protein